MSGPLTGVKVLDLTRLLPGGFATLIMADLGAEVLKIEEPGKGDYVRWTPPLKDGVSAGHLALNRSKRSMTLNLKHPDAIEVLLLLAERSDILIESFRPGVLDRLGAGYEVVSQRNPRLIWCAITGYGQDGPYKHKAGHDINYLGYAGVLGLTGPRGGDPVISGVQIADLGGGALMALPGMLAALYERERTGRGRFVDISMTDGAFAWLSFHAQSRLFEGSDGTPAPKPGTPRLSGGLACYQIYRCADGKHVTVGALEPQFWAVLCTTIGTPELIAAQFAQDQEPIINRLSEVFAAQPRDHWVAMLGDLDACVGPVNDLDEAFADPQIRSRGMLAEIESTPIIANPVRVQSPDTGQEPEYRPAPGFGEHTRETLKDLGFDEARIEALHQSGAL